jgi:SAM-dependent methyltransferase
MSEEYTADNLLDRHTPRGRMEQQYAREEARERAILAARLGMAGGEVLSVGSGWLPGRHLFPAPAWRLTAVDLDADKHRWLEQEGLADETHVARAGELGFLGEGRFDVVLYRYVLHHVVFQEPLLPILEEARRLLRPGGALVVIEPGLFHPVGAALALANKAGLGVRVHGTPDDVPLSPRVLARDARAAGFETELHAVSYVWRRLPLALQRAVGAADGLGSTPGARWLGHTFLLLGRR